LDVYAAQVLRRHGTTWRVDVEPKAGEMHSALLYSLARELLGNAAKHAHAGHVDLRIVLDGDVVRLTVADDGTGFVHPAFDTSGHFGLLTARHRVAAAGGTLAVSTQPAKGSTIVAELPARVLDQRLR
jgi:signal transduction histidine kinase